MAVLILLGLVVVSESVDRLLPFVIVTPYMHRTHQSVVLAEGNSNLRPSPSTTRSVTAGDTRHDFIDQTNS
ncbi:hypothetical protein MCERE10_02789 [Burkholderiaceae bacterium]